MHIHAAALITAMKRATQSAAHTFPSILQNSRLQLQSTVQRRAEAADSLRHVLTNDGFANPADAMRLLSKMSALMASAREGMLKA